MPLTNSLTSTPHLSRLPTVPAHPTNHLTLPLRSGHSEYGTVAQYQFPRRGYPRMCGPLVPRMAEARCVPQQRVACREGVNEKASMSHDRRGNCHAVRPASQNITAIDSTCCVKASWLFLLGEKGETETCARCCFCCSRHCRSTSRMRIQETWLSALGN